MTTKKSANIIAKPRGREIIVTQVLDAPREEVFRTQIDPALIPQWWGPKIYATTVEKMETRHGGLWRIVQREPDGREHVFKGVYHLVTPPERIVRTFEYEGVPGHVLLETATLEEKDGKTKLTRTSVFETVEDRDGMLQSGMEAGVTESMSRLEELMRRLKR
jgi:uncharacterized protein YndB with AHSA1/START domain